MQRVRPRVGMVGAGLVLLLASTVAAAGATTPAFTASPTPGIGVSDGVVYAAVSVGPVLVVGGSFTSVRDPATGTTVRRDRLAAFDTATGALLPEWNPGADGTVHALETDGSRLWVGGSFTTIGGVPSSRVAALDPATGAVVPGFTARASSTVFALESAGGRLYAGGHFAVMNGAGTGRLAALDPVTGALVPGWSGSADATVRAIVEVPGTGTLAVGGAFTRLSGQRRSYLGSLTLLSGAVTSWAPAPECVSDTNPCTLLDLVADIDRVYGAVTGPGGRASAWSTTTGQRRWSQRGDGDVQVVELVGDTIYAGGHFTPNFGRNPVTGRTATRHEVAALDAVTGRLQRWSPDLSGGYGVWAITGGPDALWLGGGFTGVNGSSAFRKLARFAPVPAG